MKKLCCLKMSWQKSAIKIVNDWTLRFIILNFSIWFFHLGGDAFNTISSLIRHKKCVHEGATKTCPICLKKMSRNCNMKEHIDTVHKGLTNYSCEICGKKFGRQTHLNRHKKTTHNIHPTKKSNMGRPPKFPCKPLDLVHKY